MRVDENEDEDENEDGGTKMEMREVKYKARNFRQYGVWKDAVEFSAKIYKITNDMPWFEKKGLCDQLQRAVVSISSNIAEGSAKPSDIDFAHFLDMALGGSFEVETQLLICNKIGYLDDANYSVLHSGIVNIESQIAALIRNIRNK